MFEYLMLGDVRARKYSKTGARTHSILKKFAFDTTLLYNDVYVCLKVFASEQDINLKFA